MIPFVKIKLAKAKIYYGRTCKSLEIYALYGMYWSMQWQFVLLVVGNLIRLMANRLVSGFAVT